MSGSSQALCHNIGKFRYICITCRIHRDALSEPDRPEFVYRRELVKKVSLIHVTISVGRVAMATQETLGSESWRTCAMDLRGMWKVKEPFDRSAGGNRDLRSPPARYQNGASRRICCVLHEGVRLATQIPTARRFKVIGGSKELIKKIVLVDDFQVSEVCCESSRDRALSAAGHPTDNDKFSLALDVECVSHFASMTAVAG